MVLECALISRGPSPDVRDYDELVEVQCHLETSTGNNEYDGLKYDHERRDCKVTISIPLTGCEQRWKVTI
jgi:hypothetical protein